MHIHAATRLRAEWEVLTRGSSTCQLLLTCVTLKGSPAEVVAREVNEPGWISRQPHTVIAGPRKGEVISRDRYDN